MGLATQIELGGHFPQQSAAADDRADLVPMESEDINHGSFRVRWGSDVEAAGLTLVKKAVNAGHGELFSSRASAAEALGGCVYPAPLGTVTKEKADGTRKHRLIQDLRINRVNSSVVLPERLVLPRPIDLASDLAALQARRREDEQLAVGIIDYADAFMSVPLSPAERRYNCAVLPEGLRRDRAPLHPHEPPEGRLVVWRVLGFGGRPNPLVFARVTSALMRAGQALLASRRDLEEHRIRSSSGLDATARIHLHVDDAAGTFLGRPAATQESFDALLLFWLIMGAPLSWPKVSLEPVASAGAPPFRWIGVDYDMVGQQARMRLPADFVSELAEMLEGFARRSGRVTDREASVLCGRAARVAYVAPAAAPFAAALRAALADSRGTALKRRRRGQHGEHAASRFAVAASWFLALLRDRPVPSMPEIRLERLVAAGGPPSLRAGACEAIIFDASPWGGGAVWVSGRTPQEIVTIDWTPQLCRTLGATRGDSACLTFFEALTLLIALQVWGCSGISSSWAVVGDNLGALTVAVSHRGRGDLAKVCREVALRQARFGLHLAVGHLPSRLNLWADPLSRLSAPSPAAVPVELAGLPRRTAPELEELFLVEPPGV